MPAMVMQLCPRERVWLDPARIGVLYAQMGGVEVQALLDRAMGELAGVRRDLARQYGARDLDGFARNLRRLRRIADHLGLTTLTCIAGDVDACLRAATPRPCRRPGRGCRAAPIRRWPADGNRRPDAPRSGARFAHATIDAFG